jgi:hypothetical protein
MAMIILMMVGLRMPMMTFHIPGRSKFLPEGSGIVGLLVGNKLRKMEALLSGSYSIRRAPRSSSGRLRKVWPAETLQEFFVISAVETSWKYIS